MQNRYTLFLVVVAVGVGMVNAAAASMDLAQQAKDSGSANGLTPAQGNLSAGLSALKTTEGARSKEAPPSDMLRGSSAANGVVRPEIPTEMSPKSVSNSPQALSMPAELQAANRKGLNALKEASSHRAGPDNGYQSLRAEFSGQPADNLVSQPAK
jgi:hypothetical protein